MCDAARGAETSTSVFGAASSLASLMASSFASAHRPAVGDAVDINAAVAAASDDPLPMLCELKCVFRML